MIRLLIRVLNALLREILSRATEWGSFDPRQEESDALLVRCTKGPTGHYSERTLASVMGNYLVETGQAEVFEGWLLE